MEKSKIYGIAGAVVFSLLTFLILWLVYMPERLMPTEEEGIVVSFGNDMEGMGFGEMIAGMDETLAPRAEPQPTEQQEWLTQERVETLVIPKQQPDKSTRKSPSSEERERSLRQQQQREVSATAEAQRRQEATMRSENLIGSAFGNSESTGSGDTDSDTKQGNPAGSGVSEGHGWSLAGRSLVGVLATPAYTSNVEGRITVNIRVDADGKVTGVTIGSPTNISDVQTRNASLAAARSTRFSNGSGISVGTITYNFRLR